MESFTFVFSVPDFEDLMKGRSGVPVSITELFARVTALNAAGHHVRIIEKNTGELIHEFLPKSRSDESSAVPNSAPPTQSK
jgi:hypothetical protein